MKDKKVKSEILIIEEKDLKKVLRSKRIEIEKVGSVIIGRESLRVEVENDGLIVGIEKREGRMEEEIIEIDEMEDKVREEEENEEIIEIRKLGLRERLEEERSIIGRVNIGGRRRELGGEGIDEIIERMKVEIGEKIGKVLGVIGSKDWKEGIGEENGFKNEKVLRIMRK